MALSIDQARALVIEFCAQYPAASKISYKLRNTQEEALDEPKATIEREGRIYGAYFPGRGYAAFAVSNFRDETHFRGTLRHEILGHFGINTFNPQEKRAVLEAIIQARDEPGMRDTWAVIDRVYSDLDDLRKAEEVYAFSCEAIEPNVRSLVSPGTRALQEVCLERRRPLTFEDLINLTTMVAEGLHDRTRSQQTFPASDFAQFKQDSPMKTSEYPVWLAVPPDDRDKVRAAAGQLDDGRAAVVWDRDAKLWCARPGCDLERINDWLPDRSRRAGGGDPEAQFLDALTQAGLIVKGMPLMDGIRHRVATVDGKPGNQDGVYCGFLDRRPGGWFINYHRADSAKDVTNWSASGGESDPTTSLHIRAAARQAQEDAARDRAILHAERTLAAKTLYDSQPAADPAHPYLVRKGIPPTPELRQTRNGALVVPFFNAAGIFKTLQFITPDGEKLLFKDAPKQEHFLVVGGPLDSARPILYAEGYATARSLNLATGLPVVMTIDAGNMVAVAKVLQQQYPAARHLFMADFDHAKDVNKGLIMATEAADLVGGQVLYPAFSADEIAQGFTDFNDLHQSRGLDAVREQTFSLIQPHDEVRTMATDSNSQAPNADQQATAEPDIQSVRSEQALAQEPDSQGANAEASIPVLAEGQLASYVDDYTRDARALTNRLGLTPLIEALYGQGKTTDEIAKTVGSALGNSVVLQERGTFINKIAETLGVPGRGPHDAGAAAFAQWQQQRGQPSQAGAYDLRADSPSELVRREVTWRKYNNTHLSDHDVRSSATMMQTRGEDHARWSLIANDSTGEASAMLHAYMENGAYRNAFKRTLERLYVQYQDSPETIKTLDASTAHAVEIVRAVELRLLGEASTGATDLVEGQLLHPASSADEIASALPDFIDPDQSQGPDVVLDQTFSLIAPKSEISTMPDNSIPPAEPTVSVIPPTVRKALEQEWNRLQADFFSQQLQLGSQMKEDLRSALKTEKADLKAQLREESKDKSFGERLAVSVGIVGHGEKQSQITNINRALKELYKPEVPGFTSLSFDGQLRKLREDGQFAIERGQANPSAIGELAKDRDTWVQQQAAARLGPDGLKPLMRLDAEPWNTISEANKQERVDFVVTGLKDYPYSSSRTTEWATQGLLENVRDYSALQELRFPVAEVKATTAIDARAEAYVDAVAALPTAEVVELKPEDVRQWVALDSQDLALIEVEELREYATDVMTDNGQAAPAYAQALTTIDAPALVLTPEVAPAAARVVQPEPEQSAPQSQVIETEAPAVAVQAAVVDVPAPASQPSDTASVIDAASADAVAEPPRMAVEIPEKAPSSPVLPATVAADQVETAEATADVAPEARPAMAFAGSMVEDDTPVSSHDQEERSLPPRSAPLNGDVAVESPAFDGIVVGARIGKDEPALRASQIDKDALLARIDHEIQRDNSVLYTLDAQPAFVDRGSRLEMVPGASQSDDKVMAALLTAAQFYRGRIELTGSDAFKAKAIHLIAQHQINVSMKNPAQQLMLDEARKALNVQAGVPEAIHGDTPPAFDASPAPYVPMDGAPAPTAHTMPSTASPVSVQPLVPDVEPAPAAPVVPAVPRIDPALHQSHTAAKEGVTGKVLQCGKAPFRFEEGNTESAFIKMRTKQGVQTFWGRELAGLVRETRIEPGKMATLKWLKSEDVVIKKPIKDGQGMTVGFEDFKTHRNQWSLTPLNGPSVLTGNDEGVKLAAYDAARFAMIQNSIMAQLKLQMDPPAAPKDGLFWMTPNGQGSAKAGDELSAPRPELDKDNAGRQVMSSWSEEGRLDMALFRSDGPYLQGVVRQGDEYRHVLVSLPGHSEAPPMVFNAITEQGLVPIGVGNGINRSGGQPVQRDHVAYRLEGDTATRIGKLDNPAEMPPALHHRLGFDERWKDDNSLPKSQPAAAPSMQPSEMRPS